MQNLDHDSGPIHGESQDFLESSTRRTDEKPTHGVFMEQFPLRFPKNRWENLDSEEQHRLANAQILLDALRSAPLRTLQALVSDTELDQEAMGPALGVLDDLGLITWDDEAGDDDLLVKLIATPEEHLAVRFPDGETRWIFIARPLVEPEIPRSRIN